jgi:hypothetical protein
MHELARQRADAGPSIGGGIDRAVGRAFGGGAKTRSAGLAGCECRHANDYGAAKQGGDESIVGDGAFHKTLPKWVSPLVPEVETAPAFSLFAGGRVQNVEILWKIVATPERPELPAVPRICAAMKSNDADTGKKSFSVFRGLDWRSPD